MTQEKKTAETEKKKQGFSVPFYGCDFFPKQLLKIKIDASHRTVTQNIPQCQCEGAHCLLVTGGTGTVSVNAVEYPLSRGDFLMIEVFQCFSIQPDSGSELELYECHMSGDARLYISACPYHRNSQIEIPREPTRIHFENAETEDLSRLIQQMEKYCKPGTFQRAQYAFTLALKLYGIMRAKQYDDERKVEASRDASEE